LGPRTGTRMFLSLRYRWRVGGERNICWTYRRSAETPVCSGNRAPEFPSVRETKVDEIRDVPSTPLSGCRKANRERDRVFSFLAYRTGVRFEFWGTGSWGGSRRSKIASSFLDSLRVDQHALTQVRTGRFAKEPLGRDSASGKFRPLAMLKVSAVMQTTHSNGLFRGEGKECCFLK
jgi:hypothetical protein